MTHTTTCGVPHPSDERVLCVRPYEHRGRHEASFPGGHLSWSQDSGAVGTRTRKGDQVLPDADLKTADDQSLLIADIEERRQLGIERYGQAHRRLNGRDTLRDLYDEHLDALVYLRSLVSASEATRAELIDAVARAFHPVPDGEDEATAAIAVDRVMSWVNAKLIEGDAVHA